MAQPISDGPLRQIANFSGDIIFQFAWSPDGKKLALVRGTVNRDLVLMRDFR